MSTLLISILLATGSTPRLVESTDPINDEVSAFLIFSAGQGDLRIGCNSKGKAATFEVTARFPAHVGYAQAGLFAGGLKLAYRFDQRPADEVFWNAEGHFVYATMSRTRPMPFVQQMRGSNTLLLRIGYPAAIQQDMRFTYDEPSAALDDILERCGFSPTGKPIRAR